MLHLSPKEQQILEILINDFPDNEEIAKRTNVSVSTIRFHTQSILQKTGCKNKGSLALQYLKFKLNLPSVFDAN